MTRPRSDRTRLRRGAARAEHGDDPLPEILDAGVVAHGGVATPEGLIVLPMAYGRSSEHLYLHGAAGNAMLRTGGPAGDGPEDVDGPHWAGHVPIHCRWGAPETAQDLTLGIRMPSAVAEVQDRRLR